MTADSSTKGRFIVLEGIDGAGKTTLLPQLANWIRGTGRQVMVTREPGGTRLAEEVRKLTKQGCFQHAPVVSKLLLLFAARHDHVQTVIQPALQGGTWVVTDRFTEASYAYQGAGEGADLAMIGCLEAMTVGSVQPDVVLLLDISVTLAQERRIRRGQDQDHEDEALLNFLARVRQGYLARAAQRQDTYEIIDASTAEHEVFRQAQAALGRRFLELPPP
jgi:dTMP kinase